MKADAQAEMLLFPEIGAAIWQIQSFEDVLVHYLCIRHKLQPSIGLAEAQGVLEKTAKKTLGQLIKDLRENGGTGAVEQRLDHFLNERNWLVHRIRAENHTDISDQQRFTGLLKRIRAIGESADSLRLVFVETLWAYLHSQGVSMEEVAKQAADTLQKWGTVK